MLHLNFMITLNDTLDSIMQLDFVKRNVLEICKIARSEKDEKKSLKMLNKQRLILNLKTLKPQLLQKLFLF